MEPLKKWFEFSNLTEMPIASDILGSSNHDCRITLYPYLVICDAGYKSRRLISFSHERNWFRTLPVTK